MVGLSALFFLYTFREKVETKQLLNILFFVLAGILSTHVLRYFVKRNSWLLLPIEKILLRLGIAVILTSLLYSLLLMGLNQLFELSKSSNNIQFSSRLFANILNISIFIIPW